LPGGVAQFVHDVGAQTRRVELADCGKSERRGAGADAVAPGGRVLREDPVLIATGRTFGLGRTAITLKIVLPAATPYILAGMRVALGLALLMTILAEMLAGTGGLGYLVLENQRSFRIRQMYGWIVIIAVVGLAINAAMVIAEHKLVPWLEKYRIE
jgi:ABC-type nitrate/sulfonate/bicarbonate transport system permease component